MKTTAAAASAAFTLGWGKPLRKNKSDGVAATTIYHNVIE
jgi:RNase H-fold protein (predicted Holliday junction resolvase)